MEHDTQLQGIDIKFIYRTANDATDEMTIKYIKPPGVGVTEDDYLNSVVEAFEVIFQAWTTVTLIDIQVIKTISYTPN